jgi:hypothetical protein
MFDNFKKDNVNTILPNDIFKNNEYCGGLVYLDSGSYPEMQEWALPTNKKELKKCNWKNFFIKYSESNFMHKLNLLNCKHYVSEIDEDCIMASQANDAYWHGVFGGIYISHLRNAVYKNILKVQKHLTENTIVEDIDFDGYNEILIKNDNYVLGIDPNEGGRIFELGNLDKEFNFQNTLTRRIEPYHKKDQIKDWYDKFSLLDHFLQFPSLNSIKDCSFNEVGDFVNNPYSFEIIKGNKIILKRDGNVWYNDSLIEITVIKELVLENKGLLINYIIKNNNDFEFPFHFATEFNFNFISDSGTERYIKYGKETTTIGKDFSGEIDSVKFKDNFFDLSLNIGFDKSLVWSYPIKTIAMSEKNELESYQGTSIFINKVGKINPKSEYSYSIRIS